MDTESDCELGYAESGPDTGAYGSHSEGPMYLVTVIFDDERPDLWTSACRKCAAYMVDYYRPSDGVKSILLESF